jgi:hypothetical protein
MGQGIKGIIGIKVKMVIAIMLLIFVLSILFLINPNPRDLHTSGTIGGSSDYLKLEKSEEDNHYYISFSKQQKDDKITKLECTKKQYDFISDKEVAYHIFYRLDFLSKTEGKILEVDIESYL